MESRASSCSLPPADGPDFLDLTVNRFSVDDESDFMFPVSCHEKQNKGHNKTSGREVKFCEMKTQVNAVANMQQKCEEKHGEEEDKLRITINTTPVTIEEPRKFNADHESKRHLKSSSRELKNDETISASLKCANRNPFHLFDVKDKTARTRLNRLSQESGAELKERTLSKLSRNVKVVSSFERNDGPSVQRYYWPFMLRNLPYETKEKSKQKSKKRQPSLYEIATNLHALKKGRNTDPLVHSAQTKTVLSVAHQKCAALWVHNSLRIKKNQLPPIDSLRYSKEWIPENSVPSPYNVDCSIEASSPQKSAQINDTSKQDVALKSILETLETIQLCDLSRKELLKHSLSSVDQGKNQAIRLKRKALPVMKSSLSLKHYRNNLS